MRSLEPRAEEVLEMAEAVEEPMKSLLKTFAEEMTLGEDPEKLAKILSRGRSPEVRRLLRGVAVASKSGRGRAESSNRYGEYRYS